MEDTIKDIRNIAVAWMRLPSSLQTLMYQLSLQQLELRDRFDGEKAISQIVREAVDLRCQFHNLQGIEAVLSPGDESGTLTNNKQDSLSIHRRFVGRNVAKARRKKDFTQADLALAANMHQPYISQIEQGRFCVTYKTLAKLAHPLGVHVYDLDPSFEEPGVRVRSLRVAKGWTVNDLATRAKAKACWIKSVEDCSFHLARVDIELLAKALKVLEAEIDPEYDDIPIKRRRRPGHTSRQRGS